MTNAKRAFIQLSIIPFVIILFFTAGSCRDDGCATCPPQPKDPRTFTWQMDTLGDGSYQSFPDGIWGSAPNDVYIVSHSSSLFIGKLWHFDGIKWIDITPKYVEAFPGQHIYSFFLSDVFGFGKNNVWISGSRDTSNNPVPKKECFVMHYDGMKWNGITIPYVYDWLLALGGTSSNDIWTGGYGGLAYHYDGSQWVGYNLKDSLIIIKIIALGKNDVYAGGWITNDGTGVPRIMYYHWNGYTWSLEESRRETDPGAGFEPYFTITNGTIYSTAGTAVTKRLAKGIWQQILSDRTITFWNIVSGPGADLYALGGSTGEALYHFNGRDWYRFTQFNDPNIAFGLGWFSGDEGFVVGHDLGNGPLWPYSFVLHGK